MNLLFEDINVNLIQMIQKFVVVADLGNITKAADVLFMSQPSLSRQMIQLEKSLEVKLFCRTRQGVALTEDGAVVYSHGKNLLNAYADFSSAVLKLRDVVGGEINVAYQKSSDTVVADIHKGFIGKYPNVNITHSKQGKRNYLDLLREGKIHFAYIQEVELADCQSSIASVPVAVKQNMLLVSKENPLSERNRVHISELKDERFVVPDKLTAPCLLQFILDGCRNAGFVPNIASYARVFDDSVRDIIIYDAVSIQPYMRDVKEFARVKFLELDGFPKEYPISLAWNSKSTHPLISPYVNYVKEFVYKNKGHLLQESDA